MVSANAKGGSGHLKGPTPADCAARDTGKEITMTTTHSHDRIPDQMTDDAPVRRFAASRLTA